VKKVFVLILCLTILLVNGCASSGVKFVQSIPDARKVLVMSFLGDNLNLELIGTTVFNNKHDAADVGIWSIDDAIEMSFSENVTSRFALVRAKSIPFRKDVGQLKSEGFTNYILKLRDHKTKIYDLARSEKADYILIFSTYNSTDDKFRTSVSYEGYGVLQRSIFGISRSVIYACVCSTVLDVASEQQVARGCDVKYQEFPEKNPLDSIPAIKNDLRYLNKDDFVKLISTVAKWTSKAIGIHSTEINQ